MADYGHEYTDKQLKKLERELSKIYKQASEEISKKLEEKTAKFQEKIDKKKADLDAGKITKKEYKDWYKNQHEDIKRLTQLNDEIAKDLVNTNKIAAAIINGYTPTVYALNHNYGLYQIDNITGTTGSWTLYDKNTVEYLLQEDPDLLPKKKVNVPKDKAWNKKHVNNSIMQGIIQGESIPKIAKRLADVVGMNQRSAVRNARTAMTGAQSAGRVSSYERARDMGIDLRQKWQATYDNRTRHSHRVVDGEIVDVDAVFSNGCRFPGDPEGPGYEVYNCRCTLVPILKGFERKPLWGDEKKYAEWEKQQTPPADNNSVANKTQGGIKKPAKVSEAPTSAADAKDRQLENRIKALPKEIQEPVADAYKWLGKNLGISNPEADIVIDEKRMVGDRLHYNPMDKKIHIARTELKSFIKGKDGVADADASDIVHEYMHSAQMKYIYKNSYKAKEQESAKKAFIKDISNRTGINLTQAKIKELFGNYATRDKNEEFITMAVQKYYQMGQIGINNNNIQNKNRLAQQRWAVGNAILKYLKERM